MLTVSRLLLFRIAALAAVAAAAAVTGTSASAQLVIALDNSSVTTPIGAAAVFTGRITNNAAYPVYLNYPDYEVTDNIDNDLSGDDSYFYTYTPIFIGPGDTSPDGIIFGMTLADDPAVVGLTFSGTFSILGGPDGTSNVSAGSTDTVGTVDFNVTAGPATAPEPGSLPMAVLGLAWIVLGAGAARQARLGRLGTAAVL
jgi:hypothetical protein